MACLFIAIPGNVVAPDHTVFDYPTLRSYYGSTSFPADCTLVSVTNFVNARGIRRFIETEAPAHELWEVAEHDTPSVGESAVTNIWERKWAVRNMTELELAAFNAQRRAAVNNAREIAYRAETDSILFQALRKETTMQEWEDACEGIKTMYPFPDVVTIPE